MIREAKLSQVSNREAVWCFSMSQQICIDEFTGGKIYFNIIFNALGYTKMSRVEFYEFLVRISIKQFESKKMPVENMLAELLNILLKS